MRVITLLLFFANCLLVLNWWTPVNRGVSFSGDFVLRNPQLELLYRRGAEGGSACYLAGAFQSAIDIGRINSMNNLGVIVREHLHRYDRAPRYMVYIPSLASQELAVRRSSELSRSGMDNYVLVGGL